MRPHKARVTEALLRSLKFYQVTWESARKAGGLKNAWVKREFTPFFGDVTIAAVAITHGLSLMPDNPKNLRIPDLQLHPLPDPALNLRHLVPLERSVRLERSPLERYT